MLYQQVMLLPPALLVLSINYGEPYLSKTYTKLFLNCLSIVHTLLLARRLAPFPFQRQKKYHSDWSGCTLVQFYWIGVERNHTVLLL